MTFVTKTILGGVLAASALTLTAATASAAIVCAGNVCWHTKDAYDYPERSRVVVHQDDWRWARHERYRWREHEGRGYWRGGKWIEW